MADTSQAERDAQLDERLEVPAPTAWPLVTALGLTLLAASLTTSLGLALFGALLLVSGLAGWIGLLLPGRGVTDVAILPPELRPRPVEVSRSRVGEVEPGEPGARLLVPDRVRPYRSGLWGGLAGGAAMAAVPLLYGLVSGRGVWYPINLLAAMVLPGLRGDLGAFHAAALALALALHLIASVGVGLLIAVLLPMLPGRPILFAGLVAPLLWSGALYATLGLINPVMSASVPWSWFVASQLAYGLVAGAVITRVEPVDVIRRWSGGGGEAAS